MDNLFRLIASCNTKGLAAHKKKLVANYCCTTGVGRRRVLEYINLMIEAEKIIEKDDGLWIK